MGYSSYGKYSEEIKDWLHNNDWFKNYFDKPKEFWNKVKKMRPQINNFDLKNTFFMDIARVCQEEFEEIIFNLIKKYQKQTDAEYLYFSGGSALNINLNTKLFESHLFKDIFVPPCCSDTGLSLGAASIVHMLRGGKMKLHSPFLLNVEIEKNKMPDISKDFIEEITRRLNNKEVMGVCIGYSESGPRALGHRSILAIPTGKRMYSKVSTDIKRREWYRPVAPIIIEDIAEEVFPNSTKTKLSKYMLGNFEVNKKWIDKIPAVVHTDKTARVQVVYKDDKELKPIYDILKSMWEKYKIPCLINTSFNGSGEPITHTNKDAVETARKIGLDFLLIDNQIVNLNNNERNNK
jgi:carbamoyltransferase